MNWIIKFFGGKIAIGLGKAGAMTFINGLIFAASVIVVGAYVTITLFVFNKLYELMASVNSIVSSPANDSLSWSMQVFSSMGIWDAFVDSWSLFSPMIVSLTVMFLSKKGINFLNKLRQAVEDVTRINYI